VNKQVARLTDIEKRMLVELAEAHHFSQNTMLRILVMEAHKRFREQQAREQQQVAV
jgi:hypothetical protein